MAQPTKDKGAAVAIKVKPFTGELPKRKGPNERKETPFDDLFVILCQQARDDGNGQSTVMAVEMAYSNPDELKPVTNQLRSALKHADPNGVHGLRTWVLDDGMAFQVGPKIVRPPKEQAAA